MKLWAKIDLEQVLALLSGIFSLNDVYGQMRVSNPLTKDSISSFKKIRNYAI